MPFFGVKIKLKHLFLDTLLINFLNDLHYVYTTVSSYATSKANCLSATKD